MTSFYKKLFSLFDIHFGWLLAVSVILFSLTLYLDLIYIPSYTPAPGLIGYAVALMVGVLWGAINYISHLRVQSLYLKNNDINAFVQKLAMGYEEQMELQMYLEDYQKDLMEQGYVKKEAAEKAIASFKVQEFSDMSKDTNLFNMHAHYYLVGYAIISIIGSMILLAVTNLWIPAYLSLVVIESTLFIAAIGFTVLFFIYKLFDTFLYRKFQ